MTKGNIKDLSKIELNLHDSPVVFPEEYYQELNQRAELNQKEYEIDFSKNNRAAMELFNFGSTSVLEMCASKFFSEVIYIPLIHK